MSGDRKSSDRAAADVEPLRNEPPAELQRAQEERLIAAWKAPTGFRYWSSVNNTIVGVWYTATAFLFFLFGGGACSIDAHSAGGSRE